MKKITLLLAFLTVSFGFSQSLPFDFSDANEIFSNGGSAASMTTDPGDSDEAADPSNDVMQIDGGAGTWDNVFLNLADRVDLSNSGTNTMTFRVKPTADYGARSHLLKFENGANGSATAELAFNTVAGTEWQDISLDFDASAPGGPGDYGTVFIFMDAGSGAQGVYLIDDLAGGENIVIPAHCSSGVQDGDETGEDCGGSCPDVCANPPATAATDPPARDPADVASVFTNGVYADIAPSNGTEAFGGDGYDNFTVESPDDTRRITFAAPGDGMQFLYLSNAFDLTNFTYVHMDVYVEGPVAVGQVLTIKLINQPGTGDSDLNSSIDISAVGSGTWFSADIALDSFNGLPSSREAITLIQLIGAGPTNYGPLYFDNFYFHKNTVLGTDDFEKEVFKTYPNPTRDSWTIATKSEVKYFR
jgi:hypothetical protein